MVDVAVYKWIVLLFEQLRCLLAVNDKTFYIIYHVLQVNFEK